MAAFSLFNDILLDQKATPFEGSATFGANLLGQPTEFIVARRTQQKEFILWELGGVHTSIWRDKPLGGYAMAPKPEESPVAGVDGRNRGKGRLGHQDIIFSESSRRKVWNGYGGGFVRYLKVGFPVVDHSVRSYTDHVDYTQRITLEPGKRGGKPCIRTLRITVYDVLDYLASGMTQEQILVDFPDLTSEDIRACLAFAADRERRLMSV